MWDVGWVGEGWKKGLIMARIVRRQDSAIMKRVQETLGLRGMRMVVRIGAGKGLSEGWWAGGGVFPKGKMRFLALEELNDLFLPTMVNPWVDIIGANESSVAVCVGVCGCLDSAVVGMGYNLRRWGCRPLRWNWALFWSC